jgi:hypothetical protein
MPPLPQRLLEQASSLSQSGEYFFRDSNVDNKWCQPRRGRGPAAQASQASSSPPPLKRQLSDTGYARVGEEKEGLVLRMRPGIDKQAPESVVSKAKRLLPELDDVAKSVLVAVLGLEAVPGSVRTTVQQPLGPSANQLQK